ncbi:hypothetical protein COT42_08400 [Candidatus Saganbacteria bacterium CG08_land_8_20_14_0_20_45_16]|uniref:DUF86 domain-containing protein n=1 Tax=Candidatus Saganbacteria bacterium CG08_land_8_20_14_0_20_45_16 TaxID=2014293 RepID=A0A2H0XW05_UNCSA|nr:MAG: hypothetical protein COT42_08400 [Candidatus Saganbacteria bacterium CG08_land_8_20_14_0_20_45_16]
MTTRDNLVYLKHILDAINKAEEYIGQMNEDKFSQESLVQDGVIRQIEIIGEATKNLSEDFRNKHKQIPWKDIAGMRDKLIHGYFGVDINAVWDTAKKDLPILKTAIVKMLP